MPEPIASDRTDTRRTSRLDPVLERNIEVLRRKRAEAEHAATREEKLAGLFTRFSGSMAFVYVHLVIVIAWVAVNAGFVPGVPRFDESFVILATAASVEAIFLSTFVLISQNRAALEADRRADLDLQISLLTEHELSRVGALLADVAEKLGVERAKDPEIQELQRDVAPEEVLDELEEKRGGAG